MSRNRQPPAPDKLVTVRSFGATLRGGSFLLPQTPDWGQLIYATRGALTVSVGAGVWFVPGHRALWIPAGEAYRLEMGSSVQLRSLYIRRDRCSKLPAACRAITISSLLHELVLHIAALNTLRRRKAAHESLLVVLLDQIRAAPTAALRLPMPSDVRACRVTALLMASPASALTLADAARSAGASARTLERLFERDTGLTFIAWRQRLRALTALRLLASGTSVGETAAATGYQSASAFIAMFKRELGVTPKKLA